MTKADQKTLWTLECVGIGFGVLSAFLLHFLYGWCGFSPVVGFFSPVNESVFEHTKLVFFPYLLFALFEYLLLRRRGVVPCGFFETKSAGAMLAVVLTVSIYYLYSGILGTNLLVFDILIALGAVFCSYRFSCRRLHDGAPACGRAAAFIAVSLTLLCYFVFTYRPPEIGLFFDPMHFAYGPYPYV
ncbi:DUF6512 family protein [Feifania hominis]|uniref:Uncharacterized protein n=1 Tax=Feifania hominis TaxID=2763660 RepID=A0A926DCD4_9FIRM|nr:DUF6512 family protein [Feifania hominis]MBC8535282.1 hypothetical protein [Feifania hominis]